MARATALFVTTYQSKDGWRWRLKARNGRIVADSGEAYASRPNALRAARRLCCAVIFMGEE